MTQHDESKTAPKSPALITVPPQAHELDAFELELVAGGGTGNSLIGKAPKITF